MRQNLCNFNKINFHCTRTIKEKEEEENKNVRLVRRKHGIYFYIWREIFARPALFHKS